MHIKKKRKKRKDKPGRDKKPVGSIVQHFTKTTRELFLRALAFTGNVTHSAITAGFTRQAVYQERRKNEAFAAEWDNSLQVSHDALEYEARRRAMHGTDKPYLYEGEVVHTVKEYSDKLMMFLLTAYRPTKFNNRLVMGVDDSVRELQKERLVVEKALNDPELLKALRAVDERVKHIECTVGEPTETIVETRKE